MKFNKADIDYTLYFVTDRDLMSTPDIETAVEQACDGGATVVQLREKHASSLEFYNLALRVKGICDARSVPLIINDRLDIALAVEAAGLHVGQDDLPCTVARRLCGSDMLVGVSASNYEQAAQAAADGADYLGIGAMFATGTKTDADITTFEELSRICHEIGIPSVAIGGINQRTIPQLAGTGVDGAAVVSAIIAAPDVRAAAAEIKQLFIDTMRG